jgi:hypothetical protein
MPTKQPAAPAKPPLKQRVISELKDFLAVSAYLAVLLSALSIYTMLVSRQYDDQTPLNLTFALINALVFGKVILTGELLHLGRRSESRPLYQTILLKSIFFGLFIFAFHLLEEFVKRILHGEPRGAVLEEMSLERLAARTIIVLLALIPLFAVRELNRVLGGSRLRDLLFKHPNELPPLN